MTRYGKAALIALLFWISLASVLLAGPPPPNAAKVVNAVVTVMGLDDQGKPLSQGLGVAVGQEGRILTSAGLLVQSRGGVIKTNHGALHLVQEVGYQDGLQDLALIKAEGHSLPSAPLGSPEKVRPAQKLLVAGRGENGVVLRKLEAAGTYPLSPRLLLLQLQPDAGRTEPGAPVFTEQGELVGMLHAPAAFPPPGFHLYLLHHFALLPLAEKKPGEAREWPGNAGNGQSAGSYDSFWKGVAASLRQEWQQAATAFSAAIASLPGLPEASYGRGVARYHLGDILGSLEDFNQATRKAPTYTLAYLWTGRAWERLGNAGYARAAYQQAADLAPHFSEAWYQLGVLEYQAGDLKRAQEHLERARDDFGQAARRWWYLGRIAWSRQELEKAWSDFQRALELDAKFASAYLDGGQVLLELGRPREASRLLGKLVSLEPHRAAARYHLALAHLLSWNAAAAWEQYFTLQQTHPQMAARLASHLERNP